MIKIIEMFSGIGNFFFSFWREKKKDLTADEVFDFENRVLI